MPTGFDPTSIARKSFATEGHVPLVVVGAGDAGIAAAVEAAALGMSVMLVDEHPVPPGLLGLDVPYMVGDRMTAATRNSARMLEQVVAARPGLQAAFDAGVDVRLGTSVWAAFVSGPTSRALEGNMLGLADEERAWLVRFDRVIVAAGARDLALAVPGWDRPGVMGAQGFAAAVDLYAAFSGRRVVVLGGGAVARAAVARAKAAHLEVAAVIDVAGRDGTIEGVPLLGGRRVLGIEGAAVEAIRVARADGSDARTIECDTIVSAIDAVPTVELFDLLGCRLAFDSGLGGWVPVRDGVRCSRAGVYAAGDCAGLGGDAAAEGCNAARAAAADAGMAAPAADPVAREAGGDRDATRRAWLAAHAVQPDLPICRCEEVPLEDLLGVRPPRYLDYDKAKFAARDLKSLAADGPVNQDQIKRLTRAGMGPCQGRRCREQVQTLLAMQGNQATSSVPMPSYRAPLRPLPLSAMAAFEEAPEVKENWTAWFGIAGQWHPHWEPVPEGLEWQTRWNPGVEE